MVPGALTKVSPKRRRSWGNPNSPKAQFSRPASGCIESAQQSRTGDTNAAAVFVKDSERDSWSGLDHRHRHQGTAMWPIRVRNARAFLARRQVCRV